MKDATSLVKRLDDSARRLGGVEYNIWLSVKTTDSFFIAIKNHNPYFEEVTDRL